MHLWIIEESKKTTICQNRQSCQNDCEDECKKYEFTTAAEHYLKHTFEIFKTMKKPGILILATCFSEKSKVNELLRKYGLYAALKISADRGKLTDGRIYKLDDDQSIVLEKVHQDHAQATKTKSGKIKGTKNLVLYGHAGTGEQENFYHITEYHRDSYLGGFYGVSGKIG